MTITELITPEIIGIDDDHDQVDYWANRIRATMAKSVEGIIETGLSFQACRDRNDGLYLATLAELGISQPAASCYRQVAKVFGGINTVNTLPASWGTLYDLSRLDAPVLEAAIADGRVRPDMTRKDVKQLVASKPTASSKAIIWNPSPDAALYSAIVIDPPWKYGNTSTRGAAEDHYGTMTMDELAEMTLPAADNCHLYLWVTNNFMREGFNLLDAWGFEQKTILTWVKPQMGMGNYFRSFTEHVLFATKGKHPTLRNDCPNWFVADRQRHSQKPDSFYDLVESSSPGPYMEMFARRRRFGWASWGNEV